MEKAAISDGDVDHSRFTNPGLQYRAVLGASLGTLFEWYDFYLYGSLAGFFSTLFFPKDNPTAGFLAALATYGAGFLIRPFGAIVFEVSAIVSGAKRRFW